MSNKDQEAFNIDPRLLSGSLELGDWSVSRVLLKNNVSYPWLILVPRIQEIEDFDEISQPLRYQLMDEISRLSSIMRSYFKPDKLNVGYLGNMVPQLHVHLVARFINDPLWPQGVWQAAQENKPYSEKALSPIIKDLRALINCD